MLSTVYCSREQWRMHKMKEKAKEKGKRKSSGWWWKRRRPVVSCSSLFTCNMNNGECRRQMRRRRGRGRLVAGSGNGEGRW